MKRFWKKIVCLTMTATMAFGLVACGNSKKENNSNSDKTTATTQATTTEEPEEEKTVLTVLTDKTGLVNTKLAEYKAAFEESHEDVVVEFEAIANYEEEVTKRLESGDYGDVLLIPDSVKNGKLADYFEPLGMVDGLKETYNEKYLQERTVGGVVYGLPRYAHVYGVAFNEVVLSKAEVVELPDTSNEFLSMLEQIQKTQPDVIPYYTGYLNGEWLSQWQPNAWGALTGNADYRNNGIVNENSPFYRGKANYVLHKLLYDIVKNGLCEEFTEGDNWKPIFRMMNRGEIGTMMLSSSYLHDLQVADVNPDDISFMPFPYNIEGKQYASVELDYSYAINKNSENKALAREWIDYILLKSGFAASEGAVSIRKGAALPDVLSNFKGVEFVVNNPATIQYAGQYDKLNELSGIYLDSDVEKIRLIQSALGETEESFQDIMMDWNKRWNDASLGIGYNTGEEKEE